MDSSILNRLRDTIVFEYNKRLGHFVVFEDGEHFGPSLSIDQMMQLSQEIADLAQKAKADSIVDGFRDDFEVIKRQCGGLIVRELLSEYNNKQWVLEHSEVVRFAHDLIALSAPKSEGEGNA